MVHVMVQVLDVEKGNLQVSDLSESINSIKQENCRKECSSTRSNMNHFNGPLG